MLKVKVFNFQDPTQKTGFGISRGPEVFQLPEKASGEPISQGS